MTCVGIDPFEDVDRGICEPVCPADWDSKPGKLVLLSPLPDAGDAGQAA